jgi:hypothetical protein
MHYMLLLYISDRPQPGTPDGVEEFDKVRAFHRECQERGARCGRCSRSASRALGRAA